MRDTYSGGALVSGDRIYYLTDANGNVTAVTDSSGSVQERYVYDAYGNVTFYAADWLSTLPGSSPSISNTLLFAGMQRDALTGLDYDRARWYNASTGDFITRDPAQSDPNLYRYCGNDPTGYSDPSGMAIGSTVGGASWTAPTNSCSAHPGDTGSVPPGDGNATDEERASFQSAIEQGAAQDEQRNTVLRPLGNNPSRVSPSVLNQIAQKYPSLVDIVLARTGTSQQMIVSVPGPLGGVGASYTYNLVDPWLGFGTPYYQLESRKLEAAPGDTVADIREANNQLLQAKIGYAEDYGKICSEVMLAGLMAGELPNCFPPNTLVGTEVGLRQIAEIQAGERVWAFDFETGQWRLCEVECRHDSQYSGSLVTLDLGVDEVTATAYHPFWVVEGEDLETRPELRRVRASDDRGGFLAGRWVNSQDVREGDLVFLRGCGRTKVRRASTRDERTAVSNLTVRGLHTFAVGQSLVLVHNISGTTGNVDNTLRRLYQQQNDLLKWLRSHYAQHPDWVQKMKDLKAIRDLIMNYPR